MSTVGVDFDRYACRNKQLRAGVLCGTYGPEAERANKNGASGQLHERLDTERQEDDLGDMSIEA